MSNRYALAEAVFAIDLGAIAHANATTPKVYLDPDAFFAATYITTDLRLLLEEVLSSLAGKGRFNRVLKCAVPLAVASRTHSRRSCMPLDYARASTRSPRARAFLTPAT